MSNGILITIDADTFLHPQALRRIVSRLLTGPPGTAAVAGKVLVINSRESLMSRALANVLQTNCITRDNTREHRITPDNTG